MATIVVLANTGDIAGAIQKVEEYNLNPYDPTSDWEKVATILRDAVKAAVYIEGVAEAERRQAAIDAIERERRRDPLDAEPRVTGVPPADESEEKVHHDL